MEEPQFQVQIVKPFLNGMGNSLFRFDITDYGEVIQGTFILFGYGFVCIYIKNPGSFKW